MSQIDLIPVESRRCIFSDCRRYRYLLEVVWDESKPLCQFIGLNPSTADEVKDDPTIRRIKGFCKSWGFGGLLMTNLFAFRATDPDDMKREPKPIGELTNHESRVMERNDLIISISAARAARTVAAWGVDGRHLNRAAEVCAWLRGMVCLGVTMDGSPRHPLYIAANKAPEPFN